MARTVPAGITALSGVSVTRAPLFLVSIAGLGGYSSGEAVTFASTSFAANRVKSIGSFQAGYIDRKEKTYSKLSIVLDNLADNGSSSFPFTVLDASLNFEDRIVTVYAYSPDASDGVLIWWGFCGRPTFDGTEKTVSIDAAFF